MKTSFAVAGNVRAALGRRSMTQARAAEYLKMSRDAFSRRITGKVPFDVAELEALSELLKVSYSSLVEVQEDQ